MKVADLEKQVAEQVIELMKQKGIKWVQHWQRPVAACNGVSGHTYRGGNVLTTWLWLMSNNQDDPRFISRGNLFNKDPSQNVGKLRKGSKGIPIMYYGDKTDRDGNREYTFAKVSYVWHVSQVDELDESRLVQGTLDPKPEQDIENNSSIDCWVANTGIKIVHNGSMACYRPAIDQVHMPDPSTFYSADGYYSVLLHELTHATGHEKRLNRLIYNQKGDTDYAFEELVAELGSVMLGTQLGVQIGPREDNAAYIKGWMSRLGTDPKFIFDAARKASAALTYLNDLQPQEKAEAA